MFVNMIFKINFLNEATKWIFKGVHTNYEILMQQIIERTVIVEGLMFMVEVTFHFKPILRPQITRQRCES